jgi:lambda repressor-like predicted transcriptional regulator
VAGSGVDAQEPAMAPELLSAAQDGGPGGQREIVQALEVDVEAVWASRMECSITASMVRAVKMPASRRAAGQRGR